MTAEQVGYLDGMLVTQHPPAAAASGLGVVVVPPYGWDEAASYRARRVLAQGLAAAGHSAVRLDLVGTGDSADLPDRGSALPHWQRGIDTVVAGLRAAGCSRVAAVGFGLGGLLTLRADVDDLVLWGSPANGKTALRELTTLARLEVGNETHPDGVWVYGRLLSSATCAELSAMEPSGPPHLRRALLLGRDGVAPSPGLAERLSAAGAQVDTDPGRGWGDLMVEPHRARIPSTSLDRIAHWVSKAPRVDAAVSALPLEPELALPGGRERVIGLTTSDGATVPGVLASPHRASELTVVLLNAGALRRAGPHGAWADAARRWLNAGVTTVRVDLPGIGDADGQEPSEEDLYGSEYVDVVPALLDGLSALGLPDRVVLMGLCSGAYWSFQVGQTSSRVEHVLLVNPKALVWHPTRASVEASRELRKVLLPSRWRKLVTGGLTWASVRAPVRAGVRRVREAPWEVRVRVQQARARRRGQDLVMSGFERLAAHGVGATLVFTARETLRAELTRTAVLEQLAAHPAVDLRLLDGPVETHTLAPEAVRRKVEAILDAQVRALAGQ